LLTIIVIKKVSKWPPFEALYGRKCRTPLNWIEPGERRYYGIDFVKEAEKRVHIIQQNMKATQSRQKSYADRRRRPLVFEVGDYVYLKVTPMKKKRFGVRRKLVKGSRCPRGGVNWAFLKNKCKE
jgi:hypothetical protein